MALKVICSWHTLMRYAHLCGIARQKFSQAQTEANQAELFFAIDAHRKYRDLCLEADEVIGVDLRL